MPNKNTIEKAKRDLARGESPSTAAGEFVRDEMQHIRQGKHGARSTQQAIAIGLSEARRSGIPLEAPAPGHVSDQTRRAAERDYETGQHQRKPRAPSARRARATTRALKKEGHAAAEPAALALHAKRVAASKTPAERSRAAVQAAATKGARGRSRAAQRAAKTRQRNHGERT